MQQTYRSPWCPGWRSQALHALDRPWDIIVVGGGITGAGIFALAAMMGLNVALFEQSDFSSGTSSRSSKLVHGGLRYLKQLQFLVTRESVREREHLCRVVPGLVEKMGFIYPVYARDIPPAFFVDIGLMAYTHLARGTGGYRRLSSREIGTMVPGLTLDRLKRGFLYSDAWTDDARMVLRVLHDAVHHASGTTVALNYCRVEEFLRTGGHVRGVRVCDETTGDTAEVEGRVIVNATGAWADGMRAPLGLAPRLRPLRGSHLFFSRLRFPLLYAVSFTHPDDRRLLFAYPWEGVTLVATTDIDHPMSLAQEPHISEEEYEYLLRAVQARFPDLGLTSDDVLSTQAGVRPVINTGKADPSSESRDHIVWREKGLLTVAGGKLTTFQKIARDTLRAAHDMDARIPSPPRTVELLSNVGIPDIMAGLDATLAHRLIGRYGAAATSLVATAPELMQPVQGTPYIWAELAWAAAHEAVVHLDDFMLRRFRLGILLADAGASLMPRIKDIVTPLWGWDDATWSRESARYRAIAQAAHGAAQCRKGP